MADTMDNISIADILGPWIEPDWDSGLIARLREAWNKPLQDLSREELATLLRQRFAVEQILPVARKRLADGIDDETEIFDGELQEAIEDASKAI
jgi:CDI immunity proteins